jgi:hypothetical protein
MKLTARVIGQIEIPPRAWDVGKVKLTIVHVGV